MLLVTVVLLGLTACGESSDVTAPNLSAAPPGDRMGHVHGLGVDPHDGALYVATHHGLFRLAETGVAELVAANRQDTMGFAVAGPRHFLGSGHPAAGEGGPAALGLIESTDAGRTWRTRSLAGEADFHGLEAEHGQIFGYDSQSRQVMVSADGLTWDRRARLAMADFAVSPTDAAVLLAVTQQGLSRSSDGGRTFTAVPGAPVLRLVDWPEAGTLVGVDPSGGLHASADGGLTWVRKGTVGGPPAALTAQGATEIHVATRTDIHSSSDGGVTFPVRHQLT